MKKRRKKEKKENKSGARVAVNSESIELSAEYYGSHRVRAVHRDLTFSFFKLTSSLTDCYVEAIQFNLRESTRVEWNSIVNESLM